MRLFTVTAFFLLISNLGFTQNSGLLASYFGSEGSSKASEMQIKVERLLEKIKSKRSKSDHQFLRSVFNITHRQVLKEYEQYSKLDNLFQSGNYDCLTATALYSVLLTNLGYTYSTIETDFHIFMLVHSSEGDVLFESTDPLDGFENQIEKIEERTATYKQRRVEGAYNLYHEVNALELVGLLYYNQSVKAFNEQHWTESMYLLQHAENFYSSARTSELENLLINMITQVSTNSAWPSNEDNFTVAAEEGTRKD